MRPKEKAEKLVSDFYTINCKLIKVKFSYDRGDRYNKVMPIAKESALIAVDEIIKELDRLLDFYWLDLTYWKDVKKEINKL